MFRCLFFPFVMFVWDVFNIAFGFDVLLLLVCSFKFLHCCMKL
ncbi:hypothetical protein MtrunA17_Chr8g0368431 [Medicago truncatula]|uniref:Transmembrane protein n=1 Tax=Medicago truncatula TaxID=3880 RepID=A0A396GKN0_MEDTR|nr:hypothetical protein MtrunA17_Chr8g0368431 [Medicago truncatula]